MREHARPLNKTAHRFVVINGRRRRGRVCRQSRQERAEPAAATPATAAAAEQQLLRIRVDRIHGEARSGVVVEGRGVEERVLLQKLQVARGARDEVARIHLVVRVVRQIVD